MIDVQKEKLLTFAQLAKELDVSYNTINRMVDKGTESVGGSVVKLACVKTPSGRKTSLEAYYRFLGKINEC